MPSGHSDAKRQTMTSVNKGGDPMINTSSSFNDYQNTTQQPNGPRNRSPGINIKQSNQGQVKGSGDSYSGNEFYFAGRSFKLYAGPHNLVEMVKNQSKGELTNRTTI